MLSGQLSYTMNLFYRSSMLCMLFTLSTKLQPFSIKMVWYAKKNRKKMNTPKSLSRVRIIPCEKNR